MKKIISISFVVSLLSACATNEPPIYHWGNYQQSMYENMKQENFDPVEHIAVLEKDKEKAASLNRSVPPGFYAYLGMLYADLGRGGDAASAFHQEKTLFPEATTFMDFLLNPNKSSAEAVAVAAQE